MRAMSWARRLLGCVRSSGQRGLEAGGDGGGTVAGRLPHFEPLEPRLLLSADLLPMGADDAEPVRGVCAGQY